MKVAGVEKESVKASFRPEKVEIVFEGDRASEKYDEHEGDEAAGPRKGPYMLSFTPAAPIDPEKCKFNAATRNMVIVLWKKEGGKEWEGLKAKPKFIASEKFDGTKDGFVFKTGMHGLGYYIDTNGVAAAKAVAAKVLAAAPEPTPEPDAAVACQGSIGFDQGKGSMTKESEGTIDAGSVTLTNRIMYELD